MNKEKRRILLLFLCLFSRYALCGISSAQIQDSVIPYLSNGDVFAPKNDCIAKQTSLLTEFVSRQGPDSVKWQLWLEMLENHAFVWHHEIPHKKYDLVRHLNNCTIWKNYTYSSPIMTNMGIVCHAALPCRYTNIFDTGEWERVGGIWQV